jgi:hypothetical protein
LIFKYGQDHRGFRERPINQGGEACKMSIRIIVPVGLLFVLGGCAMSSGMAALSYAANGISYASSGKGIADHALSASADKDCAMLRVVQGEDICTNDDSREDATLLTMIETPAASIGDEGAGAAGLAYSGATATPEPTQGAGSAESRGPALSALESIYSLER